MRPPTGGGPPRYQEIMAAICDDISSGRVAVRFDPAAIWDVCERQGVHVLAITGDAMARPLLDALAPGRPGLGGRDWAAGTGRPDDRVLQWRPAVTVSASTSPTVRLNEPG